MIQSISIFSMENRTSDANIYYELIFQNVSLLSLWCFVCPCIFSRCFISFTLCCSFAPHRDSCPKFSSLKLHLADKNQHKELKTHKNPQNIHWKLNMHTSRASILCLFLSLSYTHALVLSVFFALSHTLFYFFHLHTYTSFLLFSLSLPLTPDSSRTLCISSFRTLSIPLHLALSPFLFASLWNFQVWKIFKLFSSPIRFRWIDEKFRTQHTIEANINLTINIIRALQHPKHLHAAQLNDDETIATKCDHHDRASLGSAAVFQQACVYFFNGNSLANNFSCSKYSISISLSGWCSRYFQS